MAKATRLFVLAGEPSGDRLAAQFLDQLGKHLPLDLNGVGGPELARAGLQSIFPMQDLSVMGLTDVLKRLPLLLRRKTQIVDAIIAQDPDLVVLVDSQTLSKKIAKELREHGAGMPILLYVAPAVWAWKPRRARQLATLVDRIFAILPFEPEVMKDLNGPPTDYVGHPALEETSWIENPPPDGQVMLLPGSRRGELRRHLPVFRATAEALTRDGHRAGFNLPTLEQHAEWLTREVSGWDAKVDVTAGQDARQTAYRNSTTAIACSGTVTLELALAGLPATILYVPDFVQHAVWRLLGRPMIALPNILLRDRFLTECRPGPALADKVLHDARRLLTDPAARTAQRMRYAEIRTLLRNGAPGAPRIDAVGAALDLIMSGRQDRS